MKRKSQKLPEENLPPPAPPEPLWLAAVFVALLALYVFTASGQMGFEDSVGFVTSCLNGDIAHAPGYPLYALLCPPFNFVPGVSPPLAAALFSATAAAAACVLLARVAFRLTGDAKGAVCVALLYGVSRSFWNQANTPEVYTLNVLLFFLAWEVLLAWREKPDAKRLALFFFVCALGLSNHWPLFLLAAAAFPLFVWGRYAELAALCRRPAVLAAILFVVLAGLSPYLYMVWRTHHPVAFMRLPFAIEDFASFWHVVSRQALDGVDDQGGAGWLDKAQFAGFFAGRVLVKEIGLLGGMLLLFGFFRQWRRLPVHTVLGLLVLFLTASVGLILHLNFLHDGVGEQTFAPYPLIPYAVVCLWAGFAFRHRWRAPALSVVIAVAATINFSANDRREETLATDVAALYLEKLPAGGFFSSKPLLPMLAYLQHVEGKATRATVFSAPDPYFYETTLPGERLYSVNTLDYREELAEIDRYVDDNPACYNTFIPFSSTRPTREYLLFSCFREEDEAAASPDADIERFVRRLASEYPTMNGWQERKLASRLLQDVTYALLLLKSQQQIPGRWSDLLEELSFTPAGQLALSEYLVKLPNFVLSDRRAVQMAEAAEANLPELNRRQQVRLLSALGDIFESVRPRTKASLEAAKAYHARAASEVPDAASPGVQQAADFYRREALAEELAELQVLYGRALNTADRLRREE